MPTPSLFPQFMKAQAGGGGGTINRIIASELEAELPVQTAELAVPLEAELAVPLEAELPEDLEVEIT